MPREASDATKLKGALRSSKAYEQTARSLQVQRDQWKKRAELAEAELIEWKARFDKLLDVSKEKAS